jgi:hypothetical protein
VFRHPDLKPTMDTRVEVYTVERIQEYLAFIAASPGWQSYPRCLVHVCRPAN